MRSTEAQKYITPGTEEPKFLPEGPRMMSVSGHSVLVWVNIQTAALATTGNLHAHHTEELLDDFSMPCPGRPGFSLPVLNGDKALVGVEKQLRVCDLATAEWSDSLATIPDNNPRTIINDGEVVPGGRAVVFGTKDTHFKEPIAHLYLWTADDNRVSVLADKQLCSNGKVFRTDDRGLILYDIDTPTKKVVRYRLDVASRTATPDGVAIDLAEQVGFPDGMCDCGDGTVIIAFYNPDYADAGKAIRFDLATGKAVEEWTTPGSPRVTCPLLVQRPDGVKLILTTATEGMPAEVRARCPNAGCLFIADTHLDACPEPELVRIP
ncbi:SMP-30/gluconolactonase/LRE family protein [Gemmata sp.]|uniref:SMP-30/gluconolactonase/LRE family protein n=1 Tax=Gemmata sp. TaxID=1914242 RepID=UPI003F71FB72